MDLGLCLYNTLSDRLERFAPASDPVGIYVCGITPYDSTHLGHAFTYVMADVLVRRLLHAGLRVRYVQNLTDIDDAILRAARQRHTDWRTLGLAWARRYIEDMQRLNVLPPERLPLATESIDLMIDAVARLVEHGHAYPAGGNVYFAVGSFGAYGSLGHLNREQMLAKAGESGEDPGDPHKRDPLDFLLWRAHEPGEPAWESPWGRGRPGWHIECSTMAARELGDTIDIHGGGADLVYPHHEGEIAQSECLTGKRPFVRFWFHTAMVRNEDEKMSKRLGNLVMVRDLLEEFSADALRLYLVGHHYRHSWDHDRPGLLAARDLEQKLAAALDAARTRGGGEAPAAASSPGDEPSDRQLCGCRAEFIAALDQDLDTPRAVAELSRLADRMLEARRDDRRSPGAPSLLRELAELLGLELGRESPPPGAARGWSAHLRHVEAAYGEATGTVPVADVRAASGDESA